MINLIEIPEGLSEKKWIGGFLCPIKELSCHIDYVNRAAFIWIAAQWGNYRHNFPSLDEAIKEAEKLVSKINGEPTEQKPVDKIPKPVKVSGEII